MKLWILLLLIIQIFAKPSSKSHSQAIISDILIHFQQQIAKSSLLSDFSLKSQLANFSSSPPCAACHSFFSSLSYLPSTSTIHVLQKIALQYCTLAKLQIKQVCKGAIDAMTKFLVLSLFHKYTDPHSICHKLRLCPKQYNILSSDQYAKQLLKDKPNKKQQEPTKRKVINMLHLSDVHIDFFYMEGAPTHCDQPVCCRGGVKPQNSSKPAGYWGANKGDCDLPYHTFNLFLEQIKNKNIDMIIWTGDNTAHDIWRQSQAYNLNFTTIISNRIKEVFPNIPVLPTIGNHQSFPVNVYDFGNQSNFNNVLATVWGDWIDENGLKEIKQNGYFHTKVEKYNLVLISLNTQAWNDENWFLLRDPTDPGGMLKWMEKVLRQAETDGNLVYIIGHIPPNSALIQFSRRYNAIVDRFNYIIRGQFYGHSHREHIAFFSAINDTQQRIIGNYFIPPSLTTYSNKNSNYRIMKVDVDTMKVLDYQQYALKLEKNYSRDVRPPYELTYTFLNEYGLDNMGFEGLEEFRKKLRSDEATQIKYSYHIHGDMTPGKPSPTLHCETYPTGEMVDICEKGKFEMSKFQKVSGVWRERKK